MLPTVAVDEGAEDVIFLTTDWPRTTLDVLLPWVSAADDCSLIGITC